MGIRNETATHRHPFLLCVGNAESLHAQRQSWFIPPKDTDAQIDTATEAHYVCLNKSVAAKKQLFLFFPGTGGLPAYYQLISNTAADSITLEKLS